MTSEGIGLSSEDAASRLKGFGYNEIPEEKERLLLHVAKKFTTLTAAVIEISAALSYLLGKWVEGTVMVALLVMNAVIGTLQETKAGKAIELLKQKIDIVAKVQRDGLWTTMPARELVPGDLVKIGIGDVIPADLAITDGAVSVDQSALTGESLAVERQEGDVVYAGSNAILGSAEGTVRATGPRTYYGKTAQLLQVKGPNLLIEKITLSITRVLLAIDFVFITLIIAVFLLANISFANVFTLLLTLLIASVPVALPTMSAVALSLGALQLAKAGVIVRNMNAVESAAMMDVTCLDKTGTITKNQVIISDILPWSERFSEREVLVYALATCDPVTHDPIDLAIIQRAADEGIQPEVSFTILQFTPFNPRSKKAVARVLLDGAEIAVVKGAPQVIKAQVDSVDAAAFDRLVEVQAQDGKRALAVAATSGGVTELAGIITLQDPPRDDSAALIEQLKDLKISVKMITGDNVAIAKSIAAQVGIGAVTVRMRDLKRDEPGALLAGIEAADAIAEVVPEDKFRVIDALQRTGHHVVGMTGDGVNDAPALHKAEVGIAVSTATDVARASAQVILSREGIQNIVDLVQNGRSIYRRIITWILNKVVKTFELVFFISLATIIFRRPAMSSVQMLFILFMFDFVTISISGDNVSPSPVPEKWNLRRIAIMPAVFGSLNVAESFVAITLVKAVLPGTSPGELQTFVFLMVFFSGLLTIFSVREKHRFWGSRPNRVMAGIIAVDAFAGVLIALGGFLMSPIPAVFVLFILGYESIVILFINDFVKVRVERLMARR
jgi:H+-transporting ATPase